MRGASGDNPVMPGKRRQQKIRVAKFDDVQFPNDGDLHIGGWIAFMGKKQVTVAKEAGVSEGYLSALISGKHDKDPTLSILRNIARAIGVPVQALLMPAPSKGQVARDYVLRGLPGARD